MGVLPGGMRSAPRWRSGEAAPTEARLHIGAKPLQSSHHCALNSTAGICHIREVKGKGARQGARARPPRRRGAAARPRNKFESKFMHKISGEELGSIAGHFGPCNCLAAEPNGRGFASGGEDGFVRLHHFDADYTPQGSRTSSRDAQSHASPTFAAPRRARACSSPLPRRAKEGTQYDCWAKAYVPFARPLYRPFCAAGTGASPEGGVPAVTADGGTVPKRAVSAGQAVEFSAQWCDDCNGLAPMCRRASVGAASPLRHRGALLMPPGKTPIDSIPY
eukprot:gene57766-biopygen55279